MLEPRGKMNSPTPLVYWARLSCLMPPVTAAVLGILVIPAAAQQLHFPV